MDHNLIDKICDLLQELSGCYAFEAEDTAKSILSLIAEEVGKLKDSNVYDTTDTEGEANYKSGYRSAIDAVLALLKGATI